MKITYAFMPRFECVMLLNGAFNEKPMPLAYPAASPLYVTLLPLRAWLLPYTVKLLSGKALCNTELTSVCEAAADRYIVSFAERHNYVYSPAAPHAEPPRSLPEKLLASIKSGDIAGARSLMTADLEGTVTDEGITEFFAPYSGVVENPYPDLPATHYLTHAEGGGASAFIFRTVSGKISDIEEM